MIRRFIGVVCYTTAVLVTVGWMLHAETGSTVINNNKKNGISILLIILLWVAPFLIFRRSDNDEDN